MTKSQELPKAPRSMKNIFVKDIKGNNEINSSFMIIKKLYRDGDKSVVYIGDKSGDMKASIKDESNSLTVGTVISVKGKPGNVFEVKEYRKLSNYQIEDYLPVVGRPIEDILNEIKSISDEEFKSKECIELSNYFFNNIEFLNKFKKCIGGVSMHHNYLGGLAEHTLNVMYLSKTLASRYNCRNGEIAILGAKLHDIGKIMELSVDGPFSYTLEGEIEGHIVLGVSMLEEAFRANPSIYTRDFRERIKGCIVQHHGKLEYGSPKEPNMEEAYIVHFADYIDATFNKIAIVKAGLPPRTWSQYDKRINGRIYV